MEPAKNVSLCTLCAHAPICKNQPQQSCPYLQLKPDQKKCAQSKTKEATAKPPKKSFLHILWTVFSWCVVLVCIVIAFLAGRFSTYPRIISLVPKASSSVQESSLTPEQATQQLFKAAQQGDDNQILSLCHPDFIKDNLYKIRDLMESAPQLFPHLREIKILNIRLEETATVVFSFVATDEKFSDSGKLLFRKHQGQWLVVDLDL